MRSFVERGVLAHIPIIVSVDAFENDSHVFEAVEGAPGFHSITAVRGP